LERQLAYVTQPARFLGRYTIIRFRKSECETKVTSEDRLETRPA
jgi:hypothetical protein